jgi:YD repeat-containing protein
VSRPEASDYEQPTYETHASGTRTSGLVDSFRNRANETIAFGYDALGRLTSKDLPGSEPDITYGYDLLGRMTGASQTGHALSFTHDALGRNLTQTSPQGTMTSTWDSAGRRTRLTWPDAFYVDYDYLVTGEMTAVRENGATSGFGLLATFAYDDRGRRTSLTRGDTSVASYSYDAVSRLTQLADNLVGTVNDQTTTLAYNPAGQIVGRGMTNSLYAYTTTGNGTVASTADGLNRLAGHNGATPTYDARGDLTWDGTTSYACSSENLLTSFANTGALGYDPLMRFYKSAGPTFFVHDGDWYVGEYHNGNIVARYIPGAAMDEPVGDVAKTGARTWYYQDERSSVIAGANDRGANPTVIRFDEYGRPTTGACRYGFTGGAGSLGDRAGGGRADDQSMCLRPTRR